MAALAVSGVALLRELTDPAPATACLTDSILVTVRLDRPLLPDVFVAST